MSRLKPDNTEPKKNRVKYCKTDKKYISKYKTRNSEHYVISHGRKYFGTFKTLDDALKVRDWFMVNRWDKRWLDRACKETGVVRCKRLSMNRRV